MLQRGARSLLGISRVFRIMDDNRSGTLDLLEFTKGCDESGLGFTDLDVRTLFQAFDRSGDGLIDYDEFLKIVKGPMAPRRVALVKRAYKVLDRDGSGEVDYNDICQTYNASKHPAVIEGRKTERQVLNEFLATFELALSGKADGIVTEEEFLEYYTAVSASIDNDDYFEQMIDSAWNISGSAATYKKYAKGVAIDDTKPAAGRPGRGGPQASQGTYGGFEKKATGKATMYSGVQSSDNPFMNSTAYYAGRDQPQRKSLAAQKPRPNGGLVEVPGQQSAGSSMAHHMNTKIYDQHISSHQREMEFPQPSNEASTRQQHALIIN
mgnify:CR=1 FL=1